MQHILPNMFFFSRHTSPPINLTRTKPNTHLTFLDIVHAAGPPSNFFTLNTNTTVTLLTSPHCLSITVGPHSLRPALSIHLQYWPTTNTQQPSSIRTLFVTLSFTTTKIVASFTKQHHRTPVTLLTLHCHTNFSSNPIISSATPSLFET